MADETAVTFDEKQQERVNQLIREKQGEAAREVRAELATTKERLTSLEADLQAARDEVTAAKTSKEKTEAKGDVAALTAKIEEMKSASHTETERLKGIALAAQAAEKTARSEAHSIRKNVAVQNAASKVGFIDLEEVATLTNNDVQWNADKGRFVVLGANGEVKLNAALEPMSLEEFYTDYAAKKPYLVRGDAKVGTGSTENRNSQLSNNGKYELKQLFGKESNPVLTQRLFKENPAEYTRMRAMAAEVGLVGKK